MKPRTCPPTNARSSYGPPHGFSLLELVGVLAIIAILAAALVPVVIKRVDRAAYTKEVNDLAALSNALTLQLLRSNAIPDQTTWANAVGNWVMWPAAKITTNPRGYRRVFLVDPTLNLPRVGGSGLPYLQHGNLGLTNRPSNARLLMVSTLARSHPPVPLPLSSATFNDLWNTPPNAKPSTWTTWPGNGDDLCIERLNLEPLFHQLILVNRDPGSTNGSFSINGPPSNATIVTNGSIWNNYYLDGTVVSLCSTNGLAATYVLRRNTSFVYENGAWDGQIMDCITCTNPPPATTDLANAFSVAASNFLHSPWNPNAAKASSQSTILGAMANFMVDYPMLADTAPPFAVPAAKTSNGQTVNSVYNLLVTEQANLDTYTSQGNGQGNGGLLKNK